MSVSLLSQLRTGGLFKADNATTLALANPLGYTLNNLHPVPYSGVTTLLGLVRRLRHTRTGGGGEACAAGPVGGVGYLSAVCPN